MSGMQRSSICPHCGQSYSPKVKEWNFSEWRITTEFGSYIFNSLLQARIFDLLWRRQGTPGVTREKLLDTIYADDIDGGPSVHAIGYLVTTMRKSLVSVGIFIKRGGRGREGYRLIFMTPEQAGKNLTSKRYK